MAGEHPHSLVLDERLALVAIPTDEGGRALVRYVADEETTEPEADDLSIKEALALAGAWSDLDWDEMERELECIGREAAPTPIEGP